MGSFLIDHHSNSAGIKLALMSEGASSADQNLKTPQKSRIGSSCIQLERRLTAMMPKQIRLLICFAKLDKLTEFNLIIQDFWS